MKILFFFFCAFFILLFIEGRPQYVESWITCPEATARLAYKGKEKLQKQKFPGFPVIRIDPSVEQQPMLGFGGTFTDADVYHFMRMGKKERTKALKALFDPKSGAGWNLMRISFGSTDWDRNWNFYTYDDMPAGQKDDEQLSHFSVAEDERRGHFELFREALAINPGLKFYAAVWGPPAWMKDNDKLISEGTILPEHYDEFALYLVKTIQAYQERGIEILSISPQNESLCTDGRLTPQAQYINWKSMRNLVRVIQDTFKTHAIETEIWIFDHNFIFARGWVEPFMADPANRKLFDGVAWHDYGGSEKEMARLTEKYPDVPMYLTERAHYNVDGVARILAIIRAGARNYSHFVTISDEYAGPYQWNGGSEQNTEPKPENKLSALYNLRKNGNQWFRTSGYYNFAQLSKFVQRGSHLIYSIDIGNDLVNAAFKNPDGEMIVVVVNVSENAREFVLEAENHRAFVELPSRSVGTYKISAL